MILVDSNIPMYLVGAPHPRKTDAQRLLERLISNGAKLVTDAVVFQEILHRYVAIQRRDAIQHAFDVLNSCVDDVLPVDRAVTEKARELVLGYSALSARDALHIAVMDLHRIDTILSFDRDFDFYPGIRRIS